MVIILLVIICGATWCLWEALSLKRFSNIVKKVPGPRLWPIVGNTFFFAGLRTEEFFEKMNCSSLTYGRFFRFFAFGRFYVVLCDPEDIGKILTDSENLTKSDVYRFMVPWIGDGLLTSTGEKWRRHRKAITPSFHFSSLDAFFPVLNKNGQVLSKCLEVEIGNGPFNIFDYINRAALDNIYETAMGVEKNIQSKKNSEYLKAIKTICRTASRRIYEIPLWADFIFKKTKLGNDQKQAIKFIDDSSTDMIKKRRKALESLTIKQPYDEYKKAKPAFLDMLLRSASSKMTDEEIRDEINTFMFEGHDTISSATSFLLYALANHPKIQEKVYQELIAVLGDNDEPLTMTKLADLPYLQKTIKESLRMYPPSAAIGRYLDKDLKLNDGIVIPKGVNVVVNIYAVHHDPKLWNNPENFDPENFSKDVTPFTFIPFSAGSRNCIGQKFAILEIKTLVSYIVRKYRLLPSSDPKHNLLLTSELVVISKTGQHVCLEKRKP